MHMNDNHNLKLKQTVYFARIIPKVNIYDLCELSIRTIEDSYFVGTDKRDKHAYLLPYSSIGTSIFTERKEALLVVLEAEKERDSNETMETYHEEY